MSDTDQAGSGWKAPYVGYSTLVNFIDKKCGENPIPPQIDKTFIDNVAGGVQPMLLGALKTIGFIRDDGGVEPLLEKAASSPDQRKEILKTWAEGFYADQLGLAQKNATAQMLTTSFGPSGYTGSTLRKAMGFFLTLVDDVGLPKSPHFKLPKQTPSPRKKKDADVETPPAVTPAPPGAGTSGTAGEKTVVSLGDAGTVTVFVDVRWLTLPDETFTTLRKAIRDLQGLAAGDDEEEVEEDDEEEVDP